MSARKKLEGNRYGKLAVIEHLGSDKSGQALFRCLCDCGQERRVLGYHLTAGHTKSCGCVNPGRRLRPYEAVFNTLRREAARSQKVVELTYEDFLTFTRIPCCHYCGHSVLWNEYNAKSSVYNLDRIDNTLGYLKNNLVVCCRRCNYSKADRFTYEEWLQIGALIRSWEGK
jgi:hypothetical protein